MKGIYLVLFLALLTICRSEVTHLTLTNFDDNVDQEEKTPWLIEFFAPWCAHCKKLQPIWEEVAEKHGSRIHFGKVDCTTDKAVCTKYGVEGYPRILYFPRGPDSGKDYKGPRTFEALDKYANRVLAPKIAELSAVSIAQYLSTNPVVVLLCDKKDSPNADATRAVFKEAADAMYDIISFASVSDPEVLRKQKVEESSILVIREKEPKTYTGDLNKESLIEWVKRNRFVLMPELDGFNFKEVSKLTNHTAIGLVSRQGQHTAEFLEMLRNLAKKYEERISVGYIDGVEWKKFAEEYEISVHTLPRLLIVDSEMEHYYPVPSNARSIGQISEVLDDILLGKIQLKYGWGVAFKQFWNNYWIAILSGVVFVILIPIILLCCIDNGSSEVQKVEKRE